MQVYKIRNTDGLFSSGGSSPRWTKRGKTGLAINHLNAHLSLIRSERERFAKQLAEPNVPKRYEEYYRNKVLDPYAGCVVVVLELVNVRETILVDGKQT